jgi:hypothetical protein
MSSGNKFDHTQISDMKKVSICTFALMLIIWLPSCYKNYYDISEDTLNKINSVSFRNDVVPIVTSGACGCHTNGTSTQVKFAYKDTIYYSAILSRSTVLYEMAKGGPHPAEGNIFFTPSQADLVIKWYDQGAKDDYTPPPITGTITYSKNILPIYNTDCKGSTCHGGAAKTLDYTYMVANEESISSMMKSGGQTHPGGPISVSAVTSATYLAWYAQGAPN